MTQDNPRMGDLNELVERLGYRVGNPSAWAEGYDETISEEIRALLALISSLVAEKSEVLERLNQFENNTKSQRFDEAVNLATGFAREYIIAQEDVLDTVRAWCSVYQHKASKAERLLAEARAALKPFADCAPHYAQPGYNMLERVIHQRSFNSSGETEAKLTRGDFAIAAAARASIGGGNG